VRLKSLSLKNYRQYKDSTIEFGDGITGIVGLNGAGKSTLVEAIAWTLYGPNAARTGKEGIKRSTASVAANVETELIMEIEGTEYKIVRVLKGGSQTADASIFAGGKQIADSVKGVEKEVAYLLKMDWKSFYTSFFARQKELNALTDLTPASRRDTIIRMLRIDAVDKVIKLINEEKKKNTLKLELLKQTVILKKPTELLAEKMVLEKSLDRLGKELNKVEGNIKGLEANLSKFKAKFNEERAVSNKYAELDKKRTGLEARLTGLSKRESELNDQIAEGKKLEKEFAKIEKAHKEYLDIEKQLKKLTIAKESEIQAGERKLGELRDKYKELGDNKKLLKVGQPCPTCGQLIKDKKTIEEHFDEEMGKIKAEGEIIKSVLKALKEEKKASIKELKFDFEEYARISKRLADLEDDYERYPEVKAKLEEKVKAEAILARVTQERKDIESDIKGIISEMKNVPFDAKEHERITEEFDTSNATLNKEKNLRGNFQREIDRLDEQVKGKLKDINEAEKARKDEKDLSEIKEKQERFINLVADYRQHLISRIRPKLSEISGELLSELTNGKYTGVELDEEYNLYIFDGNAKYPLPRFSGGEADIANLCLRLAISQLIAESSAIETGFIILDEIFGSQDIHRKALILQALNNLSKKFRQIILITHVEDIKDTVENIIEVAENEEGISYIKA
jgi:exonuclease SbcC